jgi:hypothetical protein
LELNTTDITWKADHAISSMFIDGCGSGLTEDEIHHGTKVSNLLLDLSTQLQPNQSFKGDNQTQRTTSHPAGKCPIVLDCSHLNATTVLEEHGWEIKSHPYMFTCWLKGSPFSTGEFVDWELIQGYKDAIPGSWATIFEQLQEHEEFMEPLWQDHVQEALAFIIKKLQQTNSLDFVHDPTAMMDVIPSNTNTFLASLTSGQQKKQGNRCTEKALHSEGTAVEQPLATHIYVQGTPSEEDVHSNHGEASQIHAPSPVAPSIAASAYDSTSSPLKGKGKVSAVLPAGFHDENESDESSSSEHAFVMETGIAALKSAPEDDSDDPDNVPQLQIQPSGRNITAQSFAASTPPDTASLFNAGPSKNVPKRKRAATKSSPEQRVHKRPSRK